MLWCCLSQPCPSASRGYVSFPTATVGAQIMSPSHRGGQRGSEHYDGLFKSDRSVHRLLPSAFYTPTVYCK